MIIILERDVEQNGDLIFCHTRLSRTCTELRFSLVFGCFHFDAESLSCTVITMILSHLFYRESKREIYC